MLDNRRGAARIPINDPGLAPGVSVRDVMAFAFILSPGGR